MPTSEVLTLRPAREEDPVTYAAKSVRPRLLHGGADAPRVDPRVAAQSGVDPRVSMVLAVLGGRTVDSVAAEWEIESSTLHRWVRDFLVAGSGAVTNQPDPDEARQRDRFLTAFAHELRTPLSVAQGWAMVLGDGDVPPDEVAHSITSMTDALHRLSEHVVNVELAASVSLGRLRIGIDAVEAASLGLALPGEPEVRRGREMTVYADPHLLNRVLADLVAVARRDPEPERVYLEVVEAGAWHEIRVVREGSQIGPLIIQALFDPFGANDDATGVTLGLYVARALTVAHGGILGAEGDGDRTVFLVRLPKEPSSTL